MISETIHSPQIEESLFFPLVISRGWTSRRSWPLQSPWVSWPSSWLFSRGSSWLWKRRDRLKGRTDPALKNSPVPAALQHQTPWSYQRRRDSFDFSVWTNSLRDICGRQPCEAALAAEGTWSAGPLTCSAQYLRDTFKRSTWLFGCGGSWTLLLNEYFGNTVFSLQRFPLYSAPSSTWFRFLLIRITCKNDLLPADFTATKLLFSPVMDVLWLFVVSIFLSRPFFWCTFSIL